MIIEALGCVAYDNNIIFFIQFHCLCSFKMRYLGAVVSVEFVLLRIETLNLRNAYSNEVKKVTSFS